MAISVPDRDAQNLAEVDRKIADVLGHPATSFWLRQALQTALDRDAVDAVNDAEALHELLGERATALFDQLLGPDKVAAVLLGGDNDK